MNFGKLKEQLDMTLAEYTPLLGDTGRNGFWSEAEKAFLLNRAYREFCTRTRITTKHSVVFESESEHNRFELPDDVDDITGVQYDGKPLDKKSLGYLDTRYSGTSHYDITRGGGRLYESTWRDSVGVPMHWYLEKGAMHLFPKLAVKEPIQQEGEQPFNEVYEKYVPDGRRSGIYSVTATGLVYDVVFVGTGLDTNKNYGYIVKVDDSELPSGAFSVDLDGSLLSVNIPDGVANGSNVEVTAYEPINRDRWVMDFSMQTFDDLPHIFFQHEDGVGNGGGGYDPTHIMDTDRYVYRAELVDRNTNSVIDPDSYRWSISIDNEDYMYGTTAAVFKKEGMFAASLYRIRFYLKGEIAGRFSEVAEYSRQTVNINNIDLDSSKEYEYSLKINGSPADMERYSVTLHDTGWLEVKSRYVNGYFKYGDVVEVTAVWQAEAVNTVVFEDSQLDREKAYCYIVRCNGAERNDFVTGIGSSGVLSVTFATPLTGGVTVSCNVYEEGSEPVQDERPSISIDYVYVPADMEDDLDVPEFPQSFHDAIWQYAAYLALTREGQQKQDYQKAAVYREMFEANVARACRFVDTPVDIDYSVRMPFYV